MEWSWFSRSLIGASKLGCLLLSSFKGEQYSLRGAIFTEGAILTEGDNIH